MNKIQYISIVYGYHCLTWWVSGRPKWYNLESAQYLWIELLYDSYILVFIFI